MSEEKTTPGPQTPEPPKPPMPTAAPSAAVTKPVVPPPKIPPGPGTPASPARRKFIFSWLAFAWAAFAAATAVALSTVLRFMFPNVLFEPKSSFKAGVPDDYDIGVVDIRWKVKYGVWIVRTIEGMYVLSTICTH